MTIDSMAADPQRKLCTSAGTNYTTTSSFDENQVSCRSTILHRYLFCCFGTKLKIFLLQLLSNRVDVDKKDRWAVCEFNKATCQSLFEMLSDSRKVDL